MNKIVRRASAIAWVRLLSRVNGFIMGTVLEPLGESDGH
jgi:hypothetical protein